VNGARVENNLVYGNLEAGLRVINGQIWNNTVYEPTADGVVAVGGFMVLRNNIIVTGARPAVRVETGGIPGFSNDYNVVFRTSPGALWRWGETDFSSRADLY